MRIIIEGADFTGKSTLVEKLKKKYHLDSVHVTSHDPNTFEFYKSLMLKTYLVTDRDFIGEMIWPSLFNRKGNLNKRKFEKLAELAEEVDAKIIVLSVPYETAVERWKERGENDETITFWKEADEKFRYYAGLVNAPVVDTSELTFEQFCKLYIDGQEYIMTKEEKND